MSREPIGPPDPAAGRRLALVTGTGVEHAFVAQRFIRSFPGCLVVVDTAPPKGKWKRWRRLPPSVALGRLCRALLLAAIRDRRSKRRALLRILGDHAGEVERYDGLRRVAGVNSSECVAMLEKHRPDFLLVYGTGIVGARVLATPRTIALNMHTGVSPAYRGADCAFWPLANGEPQWLGATVHECTAAVDGGRIFATARAALQRGDGIHEAFARCVQAGADLYIASVTGFLCDRPPPGTPQDLTQGREYRSWMRGFWVEVRTRWLRRGRWIVK